MRASGLHPRILRNGHPRILRNGHPRILRNSFPFFNIFFHPKHPPPPSSASASTGHNPYAFFYCYTTPKPFHPVFPSHFRGNTHLFHTNNFTASTSRGPVSGESTHYERSDISDAIASNKLMTSYIRAGNLDSALQLFHSMSFRTTVTWNTILSGFAKGLGNVEDARNLFDKIPQPDGVSYNTMLSCYLHNSSLGAARCFFEKMPLKDVVSWNTMISGLSQHGLMDEARELFSAMPQKNCVSWNAMISGYVESGCMDMAEALFWSAPIRSVVAWTAMITGFMTMGKTESAEKVFQEMPMKNLVTLNAMIAGYVENGRAEDALKLFKAMILASVRPNPSSLSSALLGCSNLSALALGRQVHQLTCKFPLCSDTTVGTSLLSMYCKCGHLDDAWKVFAGIPRKDVVSWNAMISGYAQHGAGKKALHLFNEMKKGGIHPDSITFIGVLLACNHAGLVDFGTQYFDSMYKDYGIEAKAEHYTCMIDLLGRAGKLVEAENLIRKMPFRPNAAIFGTLLGACRIHKNLELAEFAARKLLDLEPASAAGYVQLANAYAAVNRWDHVARVWRSMKDHRVIKEPGYSWTEVRTVVHEFRSGDRIHPELALIHDKLYELDHQMRLAGDEPDFESALHDSDVDQKEILLLWHSDKLART